MKGWTQGHQNIAFISYVPSVSVDLWTVDSSLHHSKFGRVVSQVNECALSRFDKVKIQNFK